MNGYRIVALLSLFAGLLAPRSLWAGADTGFYIGAGVGRSSVGDLSGDLGDADFSGDDAAYKAVLGVNFGLVPLLDLGVEGGYVSFGEPDDGGSEVELDGFDLFGLVGTNLGPVGVFGKLGVIQWDADASGGNDDGTDPAYGVGVRFQLASFQVRGEFEYFDISEIDDLSLLSVSALYTF